MVDGYNRVVEDFNTEMGIMYEELDKKLARRNHEVPSDYIERYFERYGKYPDPKFFRLGSPKLTR